MLIKDVLQIAETPVNYDFGNRSLASTNGVKVYAKLCSLAILAYIM